MAKKFQVDPFEAVVILNKKLPEDMPEVDPSCVGLTWPDPHDPFCINVWLNPVLFQQGKQAKAQLLKIIVHECVHVKQFIEQAVGTKFDVETEAYLVAKLVEEVALRAKA